MTRRQLHHAKGHDLKLVGHRLDGCIVTEDPRPPPPAANDNAPECLSFSRLGQALVAEEPPAFTRPARSAEYEIEGRARYQLIASFAAKWLYLLV